MIARYQSGALQSRTPFHRILVLAALCLGVLAQTATGQDMDRLRSEIETTDRILMRAREVVQQHANPRALQELEFAMRLQENARLTSQESSLGTQQMRRAFDLTKRARQLAQRAINIAVQQAQLEQRAMHAMRELERVLENAMERAGTAPSDRMQQLLGLAQRRLEQAREAFREQRFEEALNMSLEVRRLLENLADRTSNRDLERMLDATRRLLERAENDVSENGNAMVLLERALQMFERAEAHYAAGHLEAAIRQLRQAREMTLRAMREDSKPLDLDKVDAVLQKTASFVDDMGKQVRDSENPEAATMMENALRHMERAQELRADDKLRQSLAEARVARNLARRAAQIAGINEL